MPATKEDNPDEWAIFDALDVDNGGTLDKDELWVKLAVNGEDEATQLMELVDLNGDGVIDFDEFCQAFSDATSQFKALVTAADGAAPADAAPADAAPEPAAAGGAEKIELGAVKAALEKAKAAGKCALFQMEGENSGVASFLEYQASTIVDGKGLTLKKMQGVPVDELVETELRAKLVLAMKHGNMLVINCRNGCPPLQSDFQTEAFPPEVWQSGDCQEDIVSSTAGTKAAEVAEAIVKDDEKDQGMFMIKKGFQIVFVTQFGADDYKEFLDGAGTIPWEHTMAFEVTA